MPTKLGSAPMIRLRQAVIAATNLTETVAELRDAFGLTVCFRDPGVAEFGLTNALMPIGDQLLEVVSPQHPGTAAGRLIERRGGNCGYMVMFEVDDLDRRMDLAREQGVRTVWSGDIIEHPVSIRGRHLHPKDVGAIISLDETEPWGSWHWAGPAWSAHRDVSVVTAIAGVTIGSDDVAATTQRWNDLELTVGLTATSSGPAGPGLDAIELVAADRQLARTSVTVAGVEFRLV